MRKTRFVYALVLTLVWIGLSMLILPRADPSAAQTAVTPILRVAPADAEVVVNEITEIALEIVDVQNLYAVDIAMVFDPQVVEIVDADPNTQGIQVALGTFLDPGFVIRNAADNNQGTLRFAMTQVNPSTPRSGSGNILVIRLRGKRAGSTSPLSLTEVNMARGDTTKFSPELRSGRIRVLAVSGGNPTPTPLPAQDPSVFATPTPTAPASTPTTAPTSTAAPTPTPTSPVMEPPTAMPSPTPIPPMPTATPPSAATAVSPAQNDSSPTEIAALPAPQSPTATVPAATGADPLPTPVAESQIPERRTVEGENASANVWVGLGALGLVITLTGGWFLLRHGRTRHRRGNHEPYSDNETP